jgi:hypothetical protein
MAKRSPLEGYRTYNPRKEGYGSVQDWAAAFDTRMGREEAARVLKDDDPLVIMGFTAMPSMDELKRQYRKLIMANQAGTRFDASQAEQDALKKIIAAYCTLEDSINRRAGK